MSLPLNEKADVREATLRPSTLANTLSSSSEMPSAKKPFSTSVLMLTKGNTAIDGPVAAGACSCDAPGCAVIATGAAGMRATHQNIPPPSSSSTVRIANSRPLTFW
mgnify:CR=1 FL=1